MNDSPHSSLKVSENSAPDHSMEVISTAVIQRWMSVIELHLNEVCTIASEGKLNADQKLKISSLCRKVGHCTSQMAVLYQSLKQKSLQASYSLAEFKRNCALSKEIADLRQVVQETSSVRSTTSFADMVKKSSNNFVRPTNLSSVAIYPKDKQKSSDDTKNLVQTIIRPEQIKLQVRSLRKVKNGGVIVSTETKQDAEKLKNAVQQSSSGLTADEPCKRKPRIVVLGVPTEMSEQEVFKCIFEQNITDSFESMSLEDFLSSVKLSHKSGKRDASTCNYIIEVPASIRKILIIKSRLFINWTSCSVRDFTLVTRCYKCHQYGHAAKSCRDVAPLCGHCTEVGHSITECTKKSDTPRCATCSRYKKPNDHKTGDCECPARKAAEQRYINSVDYEGV